MRPNMTKDEVAAFYTGSPQSRQYPPSLGMAPVDIACRSNTVTEANRFSGFR
jgi:hypothetical protein